MQFKKNIVLVILLFCFCSGNSQIILSKDSTKHLYNQQAVIFDASYRIKFKIDDLAERYTPSPKEVLIADSIFIEKYNITMSSDQRVAGFRNIKNVKHKFAEYARQYFGYLDSGGNRMVFILFLNFKVSKDDKDRYYQNWQKQLIRGNGDFFEINTTRFIVNIVSGDVKHF